MTERDFVYWLQGYLELSDKENIPGFSETQVQIIKDHIKIVLEKKTPNRMTGYTQETRPAETFPLHTFAERPSYEPGPHQAPYTVTCSGDTATFEKTGRAPFIC